MNDSSAWRGPFDKAPFYIPFCNLHRNRVSKTVPSGIKYLLKGILKYGYILITRRVTKWDNMAMNIYS
jgi:hypothetical protein